MGARRTLVHLLAKGATRRDLHRGPRSLMVQFLVPAGLIGFADLVEVDVIGRDGWLSVALPLSVWMLFANAVDGAVASWRERWLLLEETISPRLLLLAAVPWPVGVFGLHVLTVAGAARVAGSDTSVDVVALLLPAALSLASGLAAGTLLARLALAHRNARSWAKGLMGIAFVAAPVVYDVAALGRVGAAWCAVYPVAAAAALARDAAGTASELSGVVVVVATTVALASGLWAFIVTGRSDISCVHEVLR